MGKRAMATATRASAGSERPADSPMTQPTLLKTAKRITLAAGEKIGVYRLLLESRWRRERLMILCYHGIARDEEHRWRPPLYMPRDLFRERMELLAQGKYNVLSLGEAIERLYTGDLPERSVAITFDDGGYDFYAEAYPVLAEFGFPATVYLTTYYCERGLPVFHLMCSYLLWKGRGRVVDLRELTGVAGERWLRDAADRRRVEEEIVEYAERHELTAEERNEMAGRLAGALEVDYDELLDKRILQLMNPAEVAEMAGKGVDIQLHTHRHRSPRDKQLYQKELQDNRDSIERIISAKPLHFCYPSGRYSPEFLPWLREENVASATTCEPGLASAQMDPLLLPRLVDVQALSSAEFKGWLTGVSAYLPRRRQRHERV